MKGFRCIVLNTLFFIFLSSCANLPEVKRTDCSVNQIELTKFVLFDFRNASVYLPKEDVLKTCEIIIDKGTNDRFNIFYNLIVNNCDSIFCVDDLYEVDSTSSSDFGWFFISVYEENIKSGNLRIFNKQSSKFIKDYYVIERLDNIGNQYFESYFSNDTMFSKFNSGFGL